jgi:hypothetical protein
LTLGVLAHFKDKKKDAAAPALPAATMGETVDFESVAVQSLNAQITMLTEQVKDRDARNAELKAQRDANAQALRDNGIPIPFV